MATGRPAPPQHGGSPPDASASVKSPVARDTADDIALVLAMRRGAPASYVAFIERFHRVLLDYSRRAGFRGDRGDDFVEELLDDLALQLTAPNAPTPEDPRMYIVAAFRHKYLNRKRADARRSRVICAAVRDSLGDVSFADQSEAVAGCSERAVRESRGPGWEEPEASASLARLSAVLSDMLNADDRRLLIAVAESIPQRRVAEWLGISHSSARKRLERLRTRLTQVAHEYAGTLEQEEARDIERFFRRCRGSIGVALATDAPKDGVAASSKITERRRQK